MASTIEQERAKKRTIQIYAILGSIAFALLFVGYLHYNVLKAENPRMETIELISAASSDIFSHPFHISFKNADIGTFMMGSAMVGCLLVMTIMTNQMKKTDDPNTVNGKAKLMDSKDLKEYNTKKTAPYGSPQNDGFRNMILSKEIRLGLDGFQTRRNCNVLVIGASGAGKSRFFAAPNILQYNTNFVITDPSGELLNDYGKALEDNGYQVKVLNIVDVYSGNRYNPFHYIKDEKDVFIIVNTLIKNTTPEGKSSGDPFWENSEKLLIGAIMLLMWHTFPEKEQNFGTLYRLLNKARIDENDANAESDLDILFEDLRARDENNLAVIQYDSFKLGGAKTLKSVLISVAVRLESFALKNIDYLTSDDDMHFESFADTKQALFVIIPTADDTFNFIVSMMYSQLFSSLYEYVETQVQNGWMVKSGDEIINVFQSKTKAGSAKAENQAKKYLHEIRRGTVIKGDKNKKLYMIQTKSGKTIGWRGTRSMAEQYQELLKKAQIEKCRRACPNHVRFILDEFANIGQIPQFDQKLATIRKYEISCNIIVQALSQLKEKYEKQWNTIGGNCDTKLLLGCDDKETLEWIVATQGKRTTRVRGDSFQAKGQGSMSINLSSIEIMTIDRLAMMQEDECYVKIRGINPYYGKKFELTEHKNYPYALKQKNKFVIQDKSNGIDKKVVPLRIKEKMQSLRNKAIFKQDEEPLRNELSEEKLKSKTKAKRDNAKAAKENLKKFEPDKSIKEQEELVSSVVSSLGIETGKDDELNKICNSVLAIQSFPKDEKLVYTNI